MADDDSDRRERRRRRSRSHSSGLNDSQKYRSEDSKRTRQSDRERNRPKHHDDNYSTRRDERPRRRSDSPDRPSRKRHRSHSRERETSQRHRRSPHRHARSNRPPNPPRPRSRSPPRHLQRSRSPPSRAPLPTQQAAFNPSRNPPGDKQSPNFARTGKLAADTHTVAGTHVTLKYNEPAEARKPAATAAWRLYSFKGAAALATVELSARSCWLFGRETRVVDFPIEHPSCSKQHAVLQFRYVERRREGGGREAGVWPYVIDLESANGTRVNGERVPERRFVEVRSGDVLAFGDSEREYVVLLPPAG